VKFVARNHNDAFKVVKVMYKILLVSFSRHGVFLISYPSTLHRLLRDYYELTLNPQSRMRRDERTSKKKDQTYF